MAIDQEFEGAAVAIFVAAILDSLDGRVARLTNTTSDFGAHYDSLADVVSFGVAPAVVGYLWLLKDLGKLGWFAVFLYVAATALRLARFNILAPKKITGFFTDCLVQLQQCLLRPSYGQLLTLVTSIQFIFQAPLLYRSPG